MSEEALAYELQQLIDKYGDSAVSVMLGNIAGDKYLSEMAEAMYFTVAVVLAEGPELEC